MNVVVCAWLLTAAAAGAARAQAPATIARCESLLVSQQEARSASQRPYFLHLRAPDGAELTYFGVRHTNDPSDTQFAGMQREFVACRPTIVFFEGSGARVDSTAEAAIRADGEPGLARYLARTAGIPVRSLEPPRDSEAASLLHRFSAEDLAMFYTLRPMEELRDRQGVGRPRLDTLLAQQLARVHRTAGLGAVLADTAALRSAFAREFPGFDPLALPADWFEPVLTSEKTAKSLFNSINFASSMFRDTYMYRELASAMLEPNARVFAEVGRDHIPAQAAALRCAIEATGR